MKLLQELQDGMLLENPARTHAVGFELGRQISPGSTIALSGSLGAGKTTITKGIAEGWGVQETVKSPSFNYYLAYRGSRGMLVHLDAYRLETSDDYDSLMIEDILEDPWLLIAEWAEKLPDRLPGSVFHFRIAETTPSTRWIHLQQEGTEADTPKT